jgi:mannose-6-phosphate isomerase-like protein (cupin superfamily)
VAHAVFTADSLEWIDRGDGSGRSLARLSDSMTQMRANLWRYPPGTHGKRHAERAQEETFVVLAGAPSMLLGEPPERVSLETGSVVVVGAGTPLQIHNDGEVEAVLFIVGAPPDRGGADYFPDAV